MMCDSKELLVGYLYGELDAIDRRAFDAHLATCAECRAELPGLQATRERLAGWAPPAPALEFRVVSGAAAPVAAPAPAWRRFAPAWGLAAAAVLVLAAAAGLANVEVRYDGDGVVVRTGWAQAGPQAPQGSNPAPPPLVVTSMSPDVAAIEQRLRDLEIAMRQTGSAGVQNVGTSAASDAELLRRVRQLISEAESRQQSDVTMRLAQVWRDFDRVRRADVAFLQQGLGQYQGVTNLEIAQQRDMLNQFIRVSGRQEK